MYVETTIPSFYVDDREAPAIVMQREWTRRWWTVAQHKFELVTSVAVWAELLQGPDHRQLPRIGLIRDLRLLPYRPELAEVAGAYLAQKLMPADLRGDAMHLAFASFFRCDYLVTWDDRHLANPNKLEHVRRVNTRLGLFCPQIVTPVQLSGGPDG